MRTRHIAMVVLLLLSAFFLYIQTFVFHHEFLWHLAAIPLEVFLAVFVVGYYLEKQEGKNYDLVSRKFRELIFRVELSDFLYHCLKVVKYPRINLSTLKDLNEEEIESVLNEIRSDKFKIDFESEEFEDFVEGFMDSEDSLTRLAENEHLMDHEKLYDTIINLRHSAHEIKLMCRKHKTEEIGSLIRTKESSLELIKNSVKLFLEFFFKYLLTQKYVSVEIKAKILDELSEYGQFHDSIHKE